MSRVEKRGERGRRAGSAENGEGAAAPSGSGERLEGSRRGCPRIHLGPDPRVPTPRPLHSLRLGEPYERPLKFADPDFRTGQPAVANLGVEPYQVEHPAAMRLGRGPGEQPLRCDRQCGAALDPERLLTAAARKVELPEIELERVRGEGKCRIH